jgi:hypothetical protein
MGRDTTTIAARHNDQIARPWHSMGESWPVRSPTLRDEASHSSALGFDNQTRSSILQNTTISQALYKTNIDRNFVMSPCLRQKTKPKIPTRNSGSNGHFIDAIEHQCSTTSPMGFDRSIRLDIMPIRLDIMRFEKLILILLLVSTVDNDRTPHRLQYGVQVRAPVLSLCTLPYPTISNQAETEPGAQSG